MTTPRKPTDKEFQQIAQRVYETIIDGTPDLLKRYEDEYKNEWHTVVFDNFGKGPNKQKILIAINNSRAIYVFQWFNEETVSLITRP
jgi:hypothetical protein